LAKIQKDSTPKTEQPKTMEENPPIKIVTEEPVNTNSNELTKEQLEKILEV
jgi:hypothetical protein